MIIFFALNLGALLLYVRWLYNLKLNIKPTSLIIALALKVLAGLCYGLIYKYYYHGIGDSLYVFQNSAILSKIFYSNPIQYFNYLLFYNYSEADFTWIDGFTLPRTFVFIKLVSIINIFTNHNYWLSGMWLSVLSFSGFAYFLHWFSGIYPKMKQSAYFSFMIFPSVIYWSSGLSKESIVMPAIFTLIVSSHKICDYFKNKTFNFNLLNQFILLFLSSYLIWLIKFYYLLNLIPFLVLYLAYYFQKRQIIILWIVIAFILSFSTIFIFKANITTLLDYILYSHNPNYGQLETKTIHNILEIRYHSLGDNMISFIINLPKASFYGIYCNIFESKTRFFQIIDRIFNILIFVLSIISLQNIVMFKKKISAEAIITLIYIFSLDIFMAFSAPNIGTLTRYRIAYLPFFIMLICIGCNLDLHINNWLSNNYKKSKNGLRSNTESN